MSHGKPFISLFPLAFPGVAGGGSCAAEACKTGLASHRVGETQICVGAGMCACRQSVDLTDADSLRGRQRHRSYVGRDTSLTGYRKWTISCQGRVSHA